MKPISLCKGPDKIVGAQCTEDCLLPKCDRTCSSSLSSRYGTRRCPSRGTLFGSSSTWRTATFTPRSSAPSITKQKCWTQQRWAQRLYKSERSIRTKEPMPKSTTLFRQVRAMQQGSLGYEHASASVLQLVASQLSSFLWLLQKTANCTFLSCHSLPIQRKSRARM